MSRASRRDYLQRIHPRCRKAGRAEKQRILERVLCQLFLSPQACHPLAEPLASGRQTRAAAAGARPDLRAQMISVLKEVWEAADYPWSVRFKALLPEWMPWIRRRYRLDAETERQLPCDQPAQYRLPPSLLSRK